LLCHCFDKKFKPFPCYRFPNHDAKVDNQTPSATLYIRYTLEHYVSQDNQAGADLEGVYGV